MTTCILCNNNAEITCELCNEKYCSQEHLSLHINHLTGDCFPFEIEEACGVGRYSSINVIYKIWLELFYWIIFSAIYDG